MSKKARKRGSRRAVGGGTPSQAAAPVGTLSGKAGDNGQPPRTPAKPQRSPAQPTWLEKGYRRLSHWLGSLPLAVILLTVFVVVLAIGTLIESWHSALIAQELVYRSWWFTLLLALLWVNIFFAAVKKWPWKKYQTGFLVTHLGLLIMVAGGILTSLSGTDSMMNLIDTSNPDVLEHPRVLANFGRLTQSSGEVIVTDESSITITELEFSPTTHQFTDGKSVSKPFNPGSFVWKTEPDEYGEPRNMTALLRVFSFLAHPFPRRFDMRFDKEVQLKVLAYYPQVRVKSSGRRGAAPEYEPDLETPPGLQQNAAGGAARCRLVNGDEKTDFWLAQESTRGPLRVGQRWFRISFRMKRKPLGFTLKLLRAEQTTDKGSQMAASYTSWVQLTDEEMGILGEDRMITMNEPLEHRGYKVYQSNYQSLTNTLGISDPSTGRPVSYSGFTVGRDPGLWFKYIGSTMLALGIACMFYMKAYFFKPRVRQRSGSPSESGQTAGGT